MTEPMEPITGSMYRGWNYEKGQIKWSLLGDWRFQNEHPDFTKWFMNADHEKLPGSNDTVYDVVRNAFNDRRHYYMQVSTPAFPSGAARGQLRRGVQLWILNDCAV
eukprot:TRINITY_DN27512_c0_g1_i1.p2 TRINITY_DN27512_c0_g1~~TRINITY_DN27512_c0_g1_i1.p2  ORF type:complete len:106 (-),score=5.93 TRINITY_DN27512_c0_g1_i1:108-425(-)